MALGTSRPRNWGTDQQQSMLAITLTRNKLAYRTEKRRTGDGVILYIAPSSGGVTLPFHSVASLFNSSRGRWHSEAAVSGQILATGCSRTDVIWKTIHQLSQGHAYDQQ